MLFDKEKVINALEIPDSYDSPLIMNVISDMSEAIAKWTEDGVMKAVVNAGFDIDKDKLVQSLQQDRERYNEAYRKGYTAGYEKRVDEIVRCKECIHGRLYDNDRLVACDYEELSKDPDWFCADGERKEDG